MPEPTTPRDARAAQVGPWRIVDIDEGQVYVGHESGEGGIFKVEQLTPYLEEFWDANF